MIYGLNLFVFLRPFPDFIPETSPSCPYSSLFGKLFWFRWGIRIESFQTKTLCYLWNGILFYCIDTTHFYNIYLQNQFSIRKYCFCLIFSCPKVFFSWKILGSRTSRHRLLKGQCHEIFAIFFSWIKAIWAPDKQAKMVLLNNSFFAKIFAKNWTQRSVSLHGVEIHTG